MLKNKALDIYIAGVGGQGTLFAARVLGQYAALAGLDCAVSEVHGMAQRGGSVATHVRMADKVYAPVIPEGGADVVLAFERLEALRSAHMVKKGGLIIVNSEQIDPMPVVAGGAEYPTNITEALKKYSDKVYEVNAAETAKQAGGLKTVNTVIVGFAAAKLNLDYGRLTAALAAVAPPKFLDDNIKSLEAGFNAGNSPLEGCPKGGVEKS